MIIPYIMENKKSLKPPTSIIANQPDTLQKMTNSLLVSRYNSPKD